MKENRPHDNAKTGEKGFEQPLTLAKQVQIIRKRQRDSGQYSEDTLSWGRSSSTSDDSISWGRGGDNSGGVVF